MPFPFAAVRVLPHTACCAAALSCASYALVGAAPSIRASWCVFHRCGCLLRSLLCSSSGVSSNARLWLQCHSPLRPCVCCLIQHAAPLLSHALHMRSSVLLLLFARRGVCSIAAA